MLHSQTDCWTSLKAGDPRSLGLLYDRYADKLFETACRITPDRELAKDALQEVFINLWNYRGSLPEIKQPDAYLIRIIQRIVYRKMKTGFKILPEQIDEQWYEAEDNAEEKRIALDTDEENYSRLKRAFTHLTDRQRTIIRMRFYDGKSYRQIADMLSMNYQSVSNLVFRAILSIRKEF